MKALLARCPIRTEIGLAIGDRGAAVSRVAITPLGPVELAAGRAEATPDQLAAALEGLLAPFAPKGKRARPTVVVGLPPLRVFFSTRPIQTDHRDAAPEELLHEMLQSPTINVDDMEVDLVRWQPGRRPLAGIVATRKKYLAAVLAALEGCEVRVVRVEPSACGLLREAARRQRPPRRARAVARVVLGASEGLAALTVADRPLIWRAFDLPAGDEARAVAAAAAALRILGKHCGLEADVDALIVHGRPDLAALPGAPGGPAIEGLKALRCDGPALDEPHAAFGLALAEGPGPESFNLARALKPRASIWEIFPHTQAALIGVLLLAATLALGHRLDALQASRRAVRAEDARHRWAARQSIDALQKQRAELVQQVDAMRAFLATRVVWSACARDLAGRVAPEIKLTAFQGRNDLEFLGAKRDPNFKSGKSLTLRLTSPILKTGTIPRQVDRFVDVLRREAAVRHELPVVELTSLAWRQEAGKAPEALCVIACRPKGDAAAKPAKPAAAGKDQPAKK